MAILNTLLYHRSRIGQSVPVFRKERIQENDRRNSRSYVLGGPAYHIAAVGMTAQNKVLEILPLTRLTTSMMWVVRSTLSLSR